MMIHWHFIFELLAIFVGWRYYSYLLKSKTSFLTENQRFIILMTGILGAFIGSRLLAILHDPIYFLQLNNLYLYLATHKTIVGALLGALVFIEITKLFLKIKQSTGDLLVYPLILGLMIGRIGCLFHGLPDKTVGIVTYLPWGIDFGDGVYRHPTSLYEMVFLGSLFFVLKKLEKKIVLLDGQLFQLFLSSYLLYRFFVGFIQPGYIWFNDLNAIQIAALLGLIYYFILFTRFMWLRNKSGLINDEN